MEIIEAEKRDGREGEERRRDEEDVMSVRTRGLWYVTTTLLVSLSTLSSQSTGDDPS
jgi:hypothetical protein